MRASDWHRAVLALGSAVVVAIAQEDAPPAAEFLRRSGGRLSVIDNYIYYDGGEVSQEGFTSWRQSNPLNVTLAIDLSKSWKPESVEMTGTARPTDTPDMFNQAIITDSKTKSFYVWGGFTSWFAPLREPTMWRFNAGSDGTGSWDDSQKPSNNEVFVGLNRAENTAYASTPDAGFIFGGMSTDRSSPDPSGNSRGFISFNFTTKAWGEHAEAPYSDDRTLWGGSATYVPGFGPNGLVFILGGIRGRGEQGTRYVDLGTLHFLDPVTKKWYSQATTGDVPGGRHQHCVGGAAGANGTFDVFVYGGANDGYQKEYGDVHVLSLPGFRWTKVHDDDAATERSEQVCAVVGNRQFLSWGGIRTYAAGETRGAWDVPDPFPQGLGIFDMSELAWKSEYDAEAGAYQSHESVSSWYSQGGLDSVEWSSSAVKALFVEEPADKGDSSSPGGDKSDNGSNSGNDNTEQPKSSSTPIGPIVGGVVGGVAVLALIATAVWFFCLRKRRQASAAPAPTGAELDNNEHKPPISYMPVYQGQGAPHQGPYYASELDGNAPPVELLGSERYGMKPSQEMYGGYYPQSR